MRGRFNKNHLLHLESKKAELDNKIHEEEKQVAPDELLIRELKAERLYLKDEISQYMQKH